MELTNLTREEKALLQRVAQHLTDYAKNTHVKLEGKLPLDYLRGMQEGMDMAKNEVWRLTGSKS